VRGKSIRPLIILILLASACTLPGIAPPTPFTFPTPNPTLTAIFAGIPTSTPAVPTLPPLPATETAAPSPTETALPTSPSNGLGRPNGAPMLAARAGGTIAIDGDLEDWAGQSYAIDDLVFGATDWRGPSDLSGELFLAWDVNSLYFGVRVTDDAFVQTATGELLYRGDSLEIQLDGDLAGDFSRTSMDGDDTQIGISPGDFASLPGQAYRWFPELQAGPLPQVDIAARRTPTGYDVEAAIPWSVFSLTPQAGDRFGFTFSLSDNDTSGVAEQQSLVSSVASRRFDDPTSWGTLALE
jgi:hypothetical protein